MMFAYYMHGSKYVKYDSLHKIEHHRDFLWYYKANFKIKPLRLETKKDKPYLYSNMCLF